MGISDEDWAILINREEANRSRAWVWVYIDIDNPNFIKWDFRTRYTYPISFDRC
jgi:hypothetical protein